MDIVESTRHDGDVQVIPTVDFIQTWLASPCDADDGDRLPPRGAGAETKYVIVTNLVAPASRGDARIHVQHQIGLANGDTILMSGNGNSEPHWFEHH